MIMLKNAHTYNTGLAKVAVQFSGGTFVVNQTWFSASTFVVKIATFAKPQNVGNNWDSQPAKEVQMNLFDDRKQNESLDRG